MPDSLDRPTEPRVDVDRETIAQILALPMDDDFAADLDAAEAPVGDPWLDS